MRGAVLRTMLAAIVLLGLGIYQFQIRSLDREENNREPAKQEIEESRASKVVAAKQDEREAKKRREIDAHNAVIWEEKIRTLRSKKRIRRSATLPPPTAPTPVAVCVAKEDSRFMTNRTIHLPPATLGNQSRLDPHSEKFRKDLFRLQNPTRCAPVGKAAVGNFARYGVGACFHLLSRPFTRAWINSVRWVLPTDVMVVDNYNPKYQPIGVGIDKNCMTGGELQCFTKAVSNCLEYKEPVHEGYNWFHQDKIEDEFVPDEYKGKGYFWWVSEQMHYLVRLSRSMEQELAAVKARLDWDARPLKLGLQVRRGDSCAAREFCFELGDYMRQARRMKQRYGVRTIFLATDSQSVIEEARTKYGDEFTFLYQEGYSRVHLEALHKQHEEDYTYNLDTCHSKGDCDAVKDMRSMLIDLSLLKECNFFVGGFSTNVARLAYELMVADKGCYPPFISIDIPWCHHGGQMLMDGGKKPISTGHRPLLGPLCTLLQLLSI